MERVVFACALFVVALVGAVAIHLRLGVGREAAREIANDALAGVFAGRLQIDALKGLGRDGVRDAHVSVFDPDGVRVIDVQHVSASASVIDVIYDLLTRRTITIDDVRIGSADVSLDETPAGLRIARAFGPRGPSSTAPGGWPSPVKLEIRRVALAHAWTHGVQASQVIDVDVDDARAFVDVSGSNVNVVLQRAEVATRAMPRGANAAGRASASVRVDADTVVFASFDGLVGDIESHARASLKNDAFAAQVEIPRAEPDAIRALVPEAPIHAITVARARVEGTFDSFAASAFVGVGAGRVCATASFDHGVIRGRATGEHLDVHAFAPNLEASDARADVTFVANRDGTLGAHGWIAPRGGNAGFVIARGSEGELDVVADLHVVDARKLAAPLGASPADGRGDAHGRFHYNPGGALQADASGALHSIVAGGTRVGDLEFEAHVRGRVDDPSIDVTASADRIVVPDLDVSSARLRVRGRKSDADVTARVNADGPFDIHARVGLASGGAFHVDDATLASDGKRIATGSFSIAHHDARIVLDARNVDLDQVRRVLGARFALSGHASVALDARVADETATGRATIDVSHVSVGRVHDASAHVDVSSSDVGWSLVSQAEVAGVGWLSVEGTNVRPNGSVFLPKSWQRATGSVHLASSGMIDAIVALANVDASNFGGAASATLELRRIRADQPPEVTLDAAVNDASVIGVVDHVDIKTHTTVTPSGLVSVHAFGGRTASSIVIENREAQRTLPISVELDAHTTIAWAAISTGELPSREVLEALPVVIDAKLPSTDARTLCASFDLRCRGTLDGTIHAEGLLASPRVRVAVKLAQLRASASPFADAVDATIAATYEHGVGRGTLSATCGQGHTIEVGADVRVPANPRDWSASMTVDAHDIPMRAPPDYSDTSVAMRLDGHASLANFHQDARAKIALVARDLEIAGERTQRAEVEMSFDGTKLAVVARTTAPDGNAELRGDATMRWERRWVPEVDVTAPLTFAIRAHQFHVRNLMPLVPLSVGEIDGRVDAEASGSLALAASQLDVHGSVVLTRGDLQSSSIGELHDVRATLVMQADGDVVLKDAQASGTSGLVRFSGRAHAPHGLLDHATATASIERNAPFPVVISGTRMGDVWGHIDLDVHPRNGGLDIALKVPKLHVVIPDVSPHALQGFDASKVIAIGVFRRGVFVPLPLVAPVRRVTRTSAPTTVHVDLGDDVEVDRGDMLRVVVDGHPTIEIGDTTRVTGQVRLVRGTLDVEGKRFAVEHGEATFTGDPTNPTLFASAGWDAPDGSRVHAEYAGPIQSGKLTLRSEPAHTTDEIVSLLVFGTPDGPAQSNASFASGAQAQALSTGASLAAQPLNKAMAQLTHLDIHARVDSGSASGAMSAVEVQIAKQISAQVGYVLGLPPPGTDPDRTWLTLAWYATARWSLDLSVGDHGSSIVDLLWHYRY